MDINFPTTKINRRYRNTVLITAVFLVGACSQGNQTGSAVITTPTRPPWCKPLPTEPPISGTRTATPNILTPYASPAVPLPTSVPVPTPHIVDLAPYLPFEDKLEVYVYRCNGQEDLVLVDPNEDPHKVIPLAEGDVILVVGPPASSMGHQPPTVQPSPTYPTDTPSPNPYPFGTPVPSETPSVTPYP